MPTPSKSVSVAVVETSSPQSMKYLTHHHHQQHQPLPLIGANQARQRSSEEETPQQHLERKSNDKRSNSSSAACQTPSPSRTAGGGEASPSPSGKHPRTLKPLTTTSTSSTSPAQSSDPLAWNISSDTKNFSKALHQAIAAKLAAARLDEQMHMNLDKHCRRIIHERCVERDEMHQSKQRAGRERISPDLPMSETDEESCAGGGALGDMSPLWRMEESSKQRRQILQSIEMRRGEEVRKRKEELEQQFFDVVSQQADDAAREHRQRMRHWSRYILSLSWLSCVLRDASANVPETSVMYSSHECSSWEFRLTPRLQQSSSLSLQQLSQGGAASGGGSRYCYQNDRFELWRLARASVLFRCLFSRSRKNVATVRIVNLLRGAHRMAKLHQAIHTFLLRIQCCQHAFRALHGLRAARAQLIQMGWDEAVIKYKEQLLKRFDSEGQIRRLIVRADAAAAKAAAAAAAQAKYASNPLEDQADEDEQHHDHNRLVIASPPTGIVATAAPLQAAHFLLPSNSFHFAQQIPELSPSDLALGDAFGNVASFDLDSVPRRMSVAMDEAAWRPLEYKRRASSQHTGGQPQLASSASFEVDKPPRDVRRSLQNERSASPGLGRRSSTQTGGGGASPSSPSTLSLLQSPGAASIGSNGSPSSPTTTNRDPALVDLVRFIQQLQLPVTRVQNTLFRLQQHVRNINEVFAAEHRTLTGAYRFDLREALSKREKGLIALLPSKPSRRFIKVTIPHALMLAFVKVEVDEQLLRGLSALRKGTSTALPPMSEETKRALDRFRWEERAIARHFKELAIQRKRREEQAKEVEPLQFPSIFRRDTMRRVVKIDDDL